MTAKRYFQNRNGARNGERKIRWMLEVTTNAMAVLSFLQIRTNGR